MVIAIRALRRELKNAQTLAEAVTWTKEYATKQAEECVEYWKKNYGDPLFANHVTLLRPTLYDAAKVYVKEIAIQFKQIENDLKRMEEEIQEGIQIEENNKKIIIKTPFKNILLELWDEMRTMNNLISKKIELASAIKIHEEDTKDLTNINHVYMSKNIPGDTSHLKNMLQLVQKNNQGDPPNSLSVVVPQYPDYEDTQFAITGSCKYGENKIKAVQREILEEIGLFVDVSNITELRVIPTATKNVTYFHVKLENSITWSEATLSRVAEINEIARMNNVKDNKAEKVCIIMTTSNQREDIEKIYGRKRSTSSDIAGKTIAIIPLGKMIEFTDEAKFPEIPEIPEKGKFDR